MLRLESTNALQFPDGGSNQSGTTRLDCLNVSRPIQHYFDGFVILNSTARLKGACCSPTAA